MKTVFIILIAISVFACRKEETDNLTLTRSIKVFYYEGSAWTGWRYELTIDSTGLMVVHEKKYLPQESERKNNYMLLAEEVDSLKHDLKNLSAFRLQNYGFGPDKPTDLPTSFLKYSLNSTSDSSAIYCPKKDEIPYELSMVLGRIKNLRMKYDIN